MVLACPSLQVFTSSLNRGRISGRIATRLHLGLLALSGSLEMSVNQMRFGLRVGRGTVPHVHHADQRKPTKTHMTAASAGLHPSKLAAHPSSQIFNLGQYLARNALAAFQSTQLVYPVLVRLNGFMLVNVHNRLPRTAIQYRSDSLIGLDILVPGLWECLTLFAQLESSWYIPPVAEPVRLLAVAPRARRLGVDRVSRRSSLVGRRLWYASAQWRL
jgi:hypothetical protein